MIFTSQTKNIISIPKKDPDCVDPENPNRIVEVKTYYRPFNSHDLKTVIKKDWVKEKDLTINVINSCTNNDIELAKKIPNLTLKCNVKKDLKKFNEPES